MYLFVKDGVIEGYALNKTMAAIGDLLIVDGQFSASPYPGAVVKYIPDQKTGWMFENTTEGERRTGLRYPDDVPALPTAEEIQQQIDYETGWRIRLAMHPVCGDTEEMGIIRDQLDRILDAIKLKPTAKFAASSEIAGVEIENARIKKTDLLGIEVEQWRPK